MRRHRILFIAVGLTLALAGCAPRPAAGDEIDTPTIPGAGPTPSVLPTTVPPTLPDPEPTPCALPTIVPPTPPAEVPGYTELDPATGLHMTGTPQEIDLASYRLKVAGQVDNPLSLSYDELRCMPKTELRCTLTCVGFFQDEATWAGVPLTHILDLAGVQDDATGIRLISADGYSTLVRLEDARDESNFLAYEWEGEPVPILHGFPVRAVFPALNGNKWVKWLVEIEVYKTE